MSPAADRDAARARGGRGVRASRPLLAALLAAGLAWHLGGCGGTSTDAGNPEFALTFLQDGEPVAFRGLIHVYADAASPGFYTPPPDDGAGFQSDERPRIAVGTSNVFLKLTESASEAIDWNTLAHASDYRVLLPRLPGTAGDEDFVIAAEKGPHEEGTVQPFNLFIDGTDGRSAFVQGLTYDPEAETFRDAEGVAFDVLEVELTPSASFTGTVDTAGFSGRPLVVYTPGSPIAAQVHGNRFHLKGLPQAKLAARIVTEDGIVFDVDEPMDATEGDPARFDNALSPLVPGRAVDTLVLPPPARVLETPVASPPGPHSFTDSVVVTLASPQDGTTLFYTLDGTEPGPSATPYAGPIVLRGSATLMAVAYRKGINHSAVSVHSYVKVPPAPVADPASLAFRDSVVVSLSTRAADGTIHYTLDNSEPGTGSPVYVRPLILKATTVLKTVTWAPGLGLSAVTEERYIHVPDSLEHP